VRTVTWQDRMQIWERWYKRLWERRGCVATLRAVSAQLRSIELFIDEKGTRVVSRGRPGGQEVKPAKVCYLDLSCHRKLARRIREAAWADPIYGEEARKLGPLGGVGLA